MAANHTKRDREADIVEFVEPMKPQFVAALPDGDEWIYEVKWDGYRAQLLKRGDDLQLLSRNAKPLGRDFLGVLDAANGLKARSCVIDGEVVALDEKGRPAFQLLQNRGSTSAPIVFYAFDLLFVDGMDLRAVPLSKRRAKLKTVIRGTALRLSPDLTGSAEKVLAAVTKLGLEGVVAKRKDSVYTSGDRAGTWQKLRVRRGQEFVVGGYRPGPGFFESILVGYYDGKALKFASKVRAGFTQHTKRQVWDLLRGREVGACPFADLPDAKRKGRWGEGITPEDMKTLQWVKPQIVVEVDFVEWTSNEHLRHASYRGLRTDKKPSQVVREEAADG